MALSPPSLHSPRRSYPTEYGSVLQEENLDTVIERIESVRKLDLNKLNGMATFDPYGVLDSVLPIDELKTERGVAFHYQQVVRVTQKQEALIHHLETHLKKAQDLHRHVFNLRRLNTELGHLTALYQIQKIAYCIYYSVSFLYDPTELFSSREPALNMEYHFAKKIFLATTTVNKVKQVQIFGKMRRGGTVEISLESDETVSLLFNRCWSTEETLTETSIYSEKSPGLPDHPFAGCFLHGELIQREPRDFELAQRAVQLAVEIFTKENYSNLYLSVTEEKHSLALKSAGFGKTEGRFARTLLQNPSLDNATFCLNKYNSPSTGFAKKVRNRDRSTKFEPAFIQVNAITKVTWEQLIEQSRILPREGVTPLPTYLFRNLNRT